MLFDVPIGRWFPMADAPVGLDNRDASAVLGLDLYVLTRPTSPTSARVFLRFDRPANDWESLPVPDIPSDVPYRLVSDGVGLIAYAATSGDDTVADVRYYPDTGWSPLPTAPARASAERAYYHVGDDPVVFTRDEPSAGGALHVDRLHALTWQPVPAPEGGGQLPLQVGPSVVFIPDAVERRQVRAQMLWTDWVWRPVGPRLTAATGSLAVNVLGADRYPSLDGPTVDLSTSKVLKQPKIPSELRPLRDPAMVVVGSDLFVFGGTIDRPAGSLPTDSAFLFHPSVSISYDD